MSQLCRPLTGYQRVFHMGDPDFNAQMAEMWTRLGVDPAAVERHFPTASKRKLQRYHSGSQQRGVEQHFEDCETLKLAMKAVRFDYEGPHKQFFPKPQWAVRRLAECDGK